MSDIKNLYETIKGRAYELRLPYPDIPQYITNNLKYDFFDWQKEAFENFLTHQSIKEIESPNAPTHLMFNMATGTGKTMLMAATILYYYKQGYTNFLFFVNQNNIVDKTENNFIDKTHNKYLFTDKIIFNEKIVNIKKVETFSDNTSDIEIKFTTIQKLYNDIHIEKENQTTLDDLHSKDIIMLADEAHHLNTDTTRKKDEQLDLDYTTEITGQTGTTEIERKGWEHTVLELILNKNGNGKNNKNVLLEFTATIPADESVAQKYSDKIIYKFGLKEFLSAGYTKEINLISSTLDKKDRILQALLFSWYRHHIALKYDIPNFKPVVLFRSKTIDESYEDYDFFLSIIENLKVSDFNFLKTIEEKIFESKAPNLFERGKSRIEKVISSIKTDKIKYSEIVEFIKHNFSEKNCIITNSKTNTTQKEKTTEEQEALLNNLEDKNNHIRAIFTVNRLTEGWDVLNLYDIVRLYQGQNTGGSSRKTPEATIKEKQLIGRGVRYYPFSFNEKLRNKRKFDDDLNHDLRILEELYYYTYDEESRYISHLKEELKKDGYIRDDKILKTFNIKKEFKKSAFYKDVKILYNEQKPNPNRKKKTLEDIRNDFNFTFKMKGFELDEQEIDFDKKNDIERLHIDKSKLQTITKKFKDFDHHILLKALNIKAKSENSIFRFEKLQEELEIDSITDILSDNYLGNFSIHIVTDAEQQFEDIHNSDKLNILLNFLDKFSFEFRSEINPKIGSDFKSRNFSYYFDVEKTKSIVRDPASEELEKELSDKKCSWYVLDSFHGTSEEKELIEFIKDTIGNLEKKYEEVYLLRNEEVYKIYDFKTGTGFQPDFLLFLKDKKAVYYQIFIEPKGDNLLEKDEWKNVFLKEITKKYGFHNILKFDNKKYSLIGLPLFNKKENLEFDSAYKNNIL